MRSAARYACDPVLFLASQEAEAERLAQQAAEEAGGLTPSQKLQIEEAQAAAWLAEIQLIEAVDRALDEIEAELVENDDLPRGRLKEIRLRLDGIEARTDRQLERVLDCLDTIEPERTMPTPCGALSREALIAAYGARLDRDEELFCPLDAIQCQGRREQSETDMRCGTIGGLLELQATAVIQRADGSLETLGADRREARPRDTGPARHPLRIS